MNDLNNYADRVNIIGSLSASQIALGTLGHGKISPHISTAMGNLSAGSTHTAYTLTVDYDQAVLKIEVPGKEQAEINVFTVGQVLHIESKPKLDMKLVLAEGEMPQAPTLHLGVLTIVIDRPNKRQDIEFA